MSWRDIPLFDLYQFNPVTEQVRHRYRQRVLKPQITQGKPRVGLVQDGRLHRVYIEDIARGEVRFGEKRETKPQDRSKWLADDDVWRTIPGDEQYQVTRDGRVRNRDSGLEIQPQTHHGFAQFILMRGGKPKTHQAHYLMARAYMPHFKRRNHRIVFKDGNPLNLALDNLEQRLRTSAEQEHVASKAMQYELQKRRSREAYERKKAAATIGPAERNRLAIEAYNEALRQRAAERKARREVEPKPVSAAAEQSHSRAIADLSGWLERTEDGWKAAVRIDGTPKVLGTFKTLGEAGRVYFGAAQVAKS